MTVARLRRRWRWGAASPTRRSTRCRPADRRRYGHREYHGGNGFGGIADGTEPVAAVGRGTGIDDAGWSRKTAAVRDAMYRSRAVRSTRSRCWRPPAARTSPPWLARTGRGPPYTVAAGRTN